MLFKLRFTHSYIEKEYEPEWGRMEVKWEKN